MSTVPLLLLLENFTLRHGAIPVNGRPGAEARWGAMPGAILPALASPGYLPLQPAPVHLQGPSGIGSFRTCIRRAQDRDCAHERDGRLR